jgi:hypothetical protein
MRTRIKIDDISFIMEMVYRSFIREILTQNIIEEIESGKSMMDLMEASSTPRKLPSFKYQNLMDQIETYKLSGTPLDTKIRPIDEFMVDVYRTYCDLEKMINAGNEGLQEYEEEEEMGDMLSFFKTGTKKVMKHFTRLKMIFNDIMLHFEFTETEIRGIQLNYLNDMLKESIETEDFEMSALVRDRLETFKIKRSI